MVYSLNHIILYFAFLLIYHIFYNNNLLFFYLHITYNYIKYLNLLNLLIFYFKPYYFFQKMFSLIHIIHDSMDLLLTLSFLFQKIILYIYFLYLLNILIYFL